jgi:hypothetical protein
MNRTKRHLWVLVLVLVLLAIPTAAVFAKELGSLTITGPGIDGEMTLDHHDSMMRLEQSGFFDQALSARPPENLGAGYDITAYLNLDGKIVPFVQMVYYATDGSQPGYVHFTGRLTGETLRPVDQWRQLSKSADAAFLGLMDEYKITLQPAVPVAAAAEAAPVVKAASEAAAPAAKEPVSEPVSEPAVIQPETSKAQAPAETPTVSAIPNQLVLALAASLLVLLGAGLMIRRRAASQRSSQA